MVMQMRRKQIMTSSLKLPNFCNFRSILLLSIMLMSRDRAYLHPVFVSGLLQLFQAQQCPISSVRLDSTLVIFLPVTPVKHQFQVLAFSLNIFPHQNPNRKLENVKLSDTSSSIAKSSCRCGVNRKCCHFRYGVPGSRANAYRPSSQSRYVGLREFGGLPVQAKYKTCASAKMQYFVRNAMAIRGATLVVL